MFLLKDVIFSQDDCKSLLNSVIEFTESKLYYKGNGGEMKPAIISSQRKSLSYESSMSSDDILYKKLNTSLIKLGYSLKSPTLKYSIVKYKEGHFIHPHKDGAKIFISYVVQLSEPTEYDGGEFVYWENNQRKVLEKEIGYGILIGPDVQHEVTMVTRGERHSFVLFLEYSDVINNNQSML